LIVFLAAFASENKKIIVFTILLGLSMAKA
jgi:hypothetical protein